jgi:hypothetical protein
MKRSFAWWRNLLPGSRASQRWGRRSCPVVEQLEDRRLLSTVITFDEPTVHVGDVLTTQYLSQGVEFLGPSSGGTLLPVVQAATYSDGRIHLPDRVANISNGGEFAVPDVVGRFPIWRQHVAVSVGAFAAPLAPNDTAQLTLLGYDNNHHLVAQAGPVTVTAGQGFSTVLTIDSPSANLAEFEVTSRPGLDSGKQLGIDNLTFSDPPAVWPPDFNLVAAAPAVQLEPRVVPSATDRISVIGSNQAAGMVRLTVGGVPDGVTATLRSSQVAVGDSTMLTLTAAPGAVPTTGQAVTVTVTAVPLSPGAGPTSHSASIGVYVRPTAPILDTTDADTMPSGVDLSSSSWTSDRVGGGAWLRTLNGKPPWEWTPVLHPAQEFDDGTAVSGTALPLSTRGDLSGKDVPFTHPFAADDGSAEVNHDAEFGLAPDALYTSLLGPSNFSNAPNLDGEYAHARDYATQQLNLAPIGILGVETDGGLVPDADHVGDTAHLPDGFRAQPGDRVALLGRWIVDDGHEDFHTEVHPPLLQANARVSTSNPDETDSTLLGRPYLVSQVFDDGLPLGAHLASELGKAAVNPFANIDAHPRLLPAFEGVQVLHYVVRPPTNRLSPGDQLLVSYHFTVRDGVTVQVYGDNADAVHIDVTLDSRAYQQPSDPPKQTLRVEPEDLGDRTAAAVLDSAAALLGPIAFLDLHKGIRTDRIDPLRAASPQDSSNVVLDTPVASLQSGMGVAVDNTDAQKFPIYGWLDVRWQRAIQPPLPIPVLSPSPIQIPLIPVPVLLPPHHRKHHRGHPHAHGHRSKPRAGRHGHGHGKHVAARDKAAGVTLPAGAVDALFADPDHAPAR